MDGRGEDLSGLRRWLEAQMAGFLEGWGGDDPPSLIDFACFVWDEAHRSHLLYCEDGMVLECVACGEPRPRPRPGRVPT